MKKKLLRPCITLTKAVQDKGDTAPEVMVDVPCLVFDRVLLFLEVWGNDLKPAGGSSRTQIHPLEFVLVGNSARRPGLISVNESNLEILSANRWLAPARLL